MFILSFFVESNPLAIGQFINKNEFGHYVLCFLCMTSLSLSQNKCRYVAVTILPNSSAVIMTTVPMNAPANIVAIPMTEKYAAIPAIPNEVANAR